MKRRDSKLRRKRIKSQKRRYKDALFKMQNEGIAPWDRLNYYENMECIPFFS